MQETKRALMLGFAAAAAGCATAETETNADAEIRANPPRLAAKAR